MKICLINNLYPPYSRGGAEIIVEQIALGLAGRGHQVFIISTRPLTGARPEPGSLTDIKIYRYRVFNFVSYQHLNELPKIIRIFWHLADMFDIGSYLKIRAILKKERPDLVMTHNLKGAGYLIPRAVKSLNIKQAHTLHDIQLLHPSGLLYYGREKQVRRLPATIYSALCRWLLGSPWLVISPSGWLLTLHQKRGFFKQVKTAVSANPAPSLPAPHIKYGAGSLPLRPLWERGAGIKFEDGKYKFLYVGQTEIHKGILFLIKTFKLLCEDLEATNCQLIIIGDGSKLKQARKLAEDNKNIKFLGRVDPETVSAEMKQADALIIPSLCYENSPGVIYEAMSSGLPVIASRLGGIPELILEGEGLLFNPGNEGDLMYQMKWALEQRPELKAMGERGRRKMAKYGIERYIAKLENLIK